MIAAMALALLTLAPDSIVTKDTSSLHVNIPRAMHAPVLDGRLDDAIWREAAQLTDFIQGEPLDQAPPAEKSIGYVAYDARYLYFAFRAFERNPKLIRATIFPREHGGDTDDRVTLIIDTFLDKRRAYEFKITPLGIQNDGIKIEGLPGDPSPDFVWYSTGRVDEQGWVVEAMIPWASLRFPNADPLSIGFNVVRVYGRSGEKDAWAPRKRGNPCEICEEGVLAGITGIDRHRTVDLLPFVSGSQLGARKFGFDSAAVNGAYYPYSPALSFATSRPITTVGGDVRFAPTSAIVFNGTFNPDFSQVEADDDQVRVNQRFTLFQTERRPFFLEAKDIFVNVRGDEESRTNLGDFFYSRAVVDPSAGARITSNRNGLTVGSLYVRDHSPSYFYYNGYETSGAVQLVDMPAQVAVARVRKDVLADSYFGAGFFGRQMSRAHNAVGTADFLLRRRGITLSGEGALTDDVAPRNSSLSSYLDGARRRGKYYRGRVLHSGSKLFYSATVSGADAGFRDELGRFPRVGIERYSGRIEVKQYPNSRLLQGTSQWINVSRTNRYGGGALDYTIDPGFTVRFQRRSYISFNGHVELVTLFGTPIRPDGAFVEFGSDPWQTFGIGGTVYFGQREIVDPANPRRGVGYFANVHLILRPVPQGSVELRGQRSMHRDDWSGPYLDDARIVHIKGSYQFSRELGLRLIGERSNQFNGISPNPFARHSVRNTGSALLSYELGPASFLYAGYSNTNQDLENPVVTTAGSLRTESLLFLKISYLFRL